MIRGSTDRNRGNPYRSRNCLGRLPFQNRSCMLRHPDTPTRRKSMCSSPAETDPPPNTRGHRRMEVRRRTLRQSSAGPASWLFRGSDRNPRRGDKGTTAKSKCKGKRKRAWSRKGSRPGSCARTELVNLTYGGRCRCGGRGGRRDRNAIDSQRGLH